jgi:hypothetical protein
MFISVPLRLPPLVWHPSICVPVCKPEKSIM